MKEFRPRELRLRIDEARAEFTCSPWVLKVTDRQIGDAKGEEMTLELYQVKNFDIEFANNFFYPNYTDKEQAIRMIMVPFKLNGDE